MNEKYLYDLVDEALQIQNKGGDLDAFYKLHEDYRTEISSLLASGNVVRSLSRTTAPEILRSHAVAITAHDQMRISTWNMLLAPQVLFRAAALAVFVILLGGGFAYEQNVTRKETLASFDAVAVDHQNFIDTVGEQPIVATLVQPRTNSIPFSATPKGAVPSLETTPATDLPPSTGGVRDSSPIVGLQALYEAQSALDVLQSDLTTFP